MVMFAAMGYTGRCESTQHSVDLPQPSSADGSE